MNFNQQFSPDLDYVFFARRSYERYHLRSSINFSMHKINSGTLILGTIKANFIETIERFFASDNTLSFMSSVKGTPA